MKRNQKAFFHSVIALLLCVSMLLGSTWAWFTDSVTSSSNVITSGTLDLEMYWTDDLDNGIWYDVEESAYNTIFDYDNWEPGYTVVRYIKLKNTGSLALNYELAITPASEVGKLAEAINVYFSANGTEVAQRDDLSTLNSIGMLSTVLNGGATASGTLLPYGESSLSQDVGETVVTIAMKMVEGAGNEYQDKDAGSFNVTAIATQCAYESDSFDSSYDIASTLPTIIRPSSATATVVPDAYGKVSASVTINGENATAYVPAGVQLADGVDTLKLKVTPLEATTTDITIVNDEILIPVDVHIDGIDTSNDTAITVDLGAIMPKFLNMGNYTLVHVENGTNNVMTSVDTLAELDAHNEFYYDAVTGNITVALKSFSEVAIIADTENAWNGTVDKALNGSGTADDPYIISTADELAGMAALVSESNAAYGSAEYKLIADINLGGATATDADGNDVDFYPIGYWYGEENTFKGVFDGGNHTIANVYQTTWDMNNYRTAMGVFGHVENGTVKNLTVDCFAAEGELTSVGAVTAFASGNATFENITVSNTAAKSYNKAAAGIVGTDDGDRSSFTFKNITVDSTNTFAPLWNSYDVSVAGLMGYLGEDSEVNMVNCNLSANIDAYNDVCGNNQYGWYRYAGMFIGTVDRTLADGSLDLNGITATNCTANFGDRHEFYYCEFESNSVASNGNYQYSKVNADDLDFSTTPVSCKHAHTDAEDGRAVYLPFYQLFGGYGRGVEGVDIDKYNALDIEDITKTSYNESVTKFTAKDIVSITSGKTMTLAELFDAVAGVDPAIRSSQVTVSVSPADAESTVSGVYTANATNWENATVTFNGIGLATVTVSDYYYCNATTLTVTVKEAEPVQKFDLKFPNTEKYLYRVGNLNNVQLGSLFTAIDGVEIGNVDVTVQALTGSNATAVYTANTTDWTKGTLKFNGTGPVRVTVTDNDYCIATELNLEVINATNATSAASATTTDVVLLNNCGFSTIDVTNGHTLYGNGFTMTCSKDSGRYSMGYAFVTINNGTLDNVQIITPNFSHAILYTSKLNESDYPSDGNGNYYNMRSAVMTDGNVKIANSYISGGRAAVYARSGYTTIENTTIVGGATANIHTVSAKQLLLRDVTLIQKPTTASVTNSCASYTGGTDPKTVVGFSVLLTCDGNGNATPVVLEGTLVQDAWIDESCKSYVPDGTESIVSSALSKSAYLHTVNGKSSLNLGFTFIPDSAGGSINPVITDNRTNKASVPYSTVSVGNALANATVYSYASSNGTSSDFVNVDNVFNAEAQGIVAPTVSYSDTNASCEFTTEYTEESGWASKLTIDLDAVGVYNFSFAKLIAQKYGTNLTYTVKDENGNTVNTANAIALNSSITHKFTLEIQDTLNFDANGNAITNTSVVHKYPFTIVATMTSINPPSKVAEVGGTPLLVVKSKGGDWTCALPALEGVQIKYWSTTDRTYKTLALSSLTPSSTGKQNGTERTWTYNGADFTLTITGGVINESKSVYSMPVVVNNGGNKLYFVMSNTNGYVSTNTSARTVTIQYKFEDNNGGVLNFSKTWQFTYADYKSGKQYSYSDFVNGTLKEASSGGCVTSDTLVTLANGTQKPINQVTANDSLLVWNFRTGEYDVAPSSIIMNHGYDSYEIVTLNFEDGTTINTINGHGFYDADEERFIILGADNVDSYIGHSFVKADGNGITTTKLAGYSKRVEYTESWSILTAVHYNCVFADMLTLTPAEVEGSNEYLMPYVINGMKYDEEMLKADIEKYGLYTYDDVAEYMTYEQFVGLSFADFKVSVAKGYIDWEGLLKLIEIHLG